jgi:AcrR family transcriptional regulator
MEKRAPSNRPPRAASQGKQSQRERILEALAAISAEQGSAAATIQLITSRARTSKRTFYREFADKDEALAAIAGEFRERVLTAAPSSEEAKSSWLSTIREGLVALLTEIAADPDRATVVFLEPAPEGRPRGEGFLAELFERWEGAAPDPPPSPAAARAARAGAQGLIVDQLIAGRADSLPALLPEILYIALVPYLGQREALRQSQLTAQTPE